ncbi:MAG: NADH-quinone oxidoreductase subunit N [Bacteroidetes bacterium]|nr:NADH-quinone oxidoreductase subunit N [Bacteroidota bacterium]
MTTLIILSALGLVVLFSEIFGYKKIVLPFIFAGLVAALAASFIDWNIGKHYLNEMMIVDNYSIAFTVLMIAITIVWFIISPGFFRDQGSRVDHFALIIFALIGAQLLTSFGNMIMLFLAVEILSIPMYILAGSNKSNLASNEAALKYFLMGAFATGFLLFGIALIYGQTGSFNLQQISEALTTQQDGGGVMAVAGVLLIMVGLFFKVSAAPFHFWAPDVYTGAPTEITAFMSTVVKTAAFAGFFRLFATCFSASASIWVNTIMVVSALTIIVGNITAVYQTSFKRMLAYSSIAHAGYMLMAIISLNGYAQQSILFYAVAYSVSSIAAFGILLAVSHITKNDDVASFNGLAKKNPLLAFVTLLAMLSLAGIPPMAGFFAKYYIFTAALQQHYTWLVLIAVLGSLIGVFYYFRVIIALFKNENSAAEIPMTGIYKAALLFISLVALVFGIMPGLLAGLL